MDVKISEKLQEQIFNKIQLRPENTTCADCKAKGPCWASQDFGVFICLKCSGDHRNFGRHITRVRSCKLDSWTKEEVWIMESIGNQIANSYYEFKKNLIGNKISLTSNDNQRRNYIEDKYKHKKWICEGKPTPLEYIYQCRKNGIAVDKNYTNSHVGQVSDASPEYQSNNNFNNNSYQQNLNGNQNNNTIDLFAENSGDFNRKYNPKESNMKKNTFDLFEDDNNNKAEKVKNNADNINLFESTPVEKQKTFGFNENLINTTNEKKNSLVNNMNNMNNMNNNFNLMAGNQNSQPLNNPQMGNNINLMSGGVGVPQNQNINNFGTNNNFMNRNSNNFGNPNQFNQFGNVNMMRNPQGGMPAKNFAALDMMSYCW